MVEVTGVTAFAGGKAAITRTLSGRLGKGQAFRVDVRYDAALDPQAALPTPQECVDALNAVLEKQKIVFAPGSAEIEAEARDTMTALADQMRNCPDIPMEIGGHTDSQGRDTGNLALSQTRAEAVLLGLQGRRVLVGALKAQGYGETRPIADNATAEGREANRRIEFTLLVPGPAAASGIGPVVAPAGPAPGVTVILREGAAATPAAAGTGVPALAAEEPFVSSAPDEKTRRARRRPDTE
jgi:OOP family OmpA-OmpF porin